MVPLKKGTPSDDEESYYFEDQYELGSYEDFQDYENGEPDYENYNPGLKNFSSPQPKNTQSNNNILFSRQQDFSPSKPSNKYHDNSASKKMRALSNTKQSSISSADDIDDDYLEDKFLKIDKTQDASQEVELDKDDNSLELYELSDSDIPVKETEFTNRYQPTASNHYNSAEDHYNYMDNKVVETATGPRNHRTSTESVKKTSNAKEITSNTGLHTNNNSTRQDSNTSSISLQNAGDDSESDDDSFRNRHNTSINTSYYGSRAANSRGVDRLENQPVDEEHTLGIIESAFSWIRKFFTAATVFIQNFYASVSDFVSSLSTKTLVTVSVVVISILSMLLINNYTLWIPSEPWFTQPNKSPADIRELASRLMTVESEVSKLSRQTFDLENNKDAVQLQLTLLQDQLTDISRGMMLFDKKIDTMDKIGLQNDRKLSDVELTIKEIEKKLFNNHEFMLEERRLGKARNQEISQNQNGISNLALAVDNINSKIESIKTRVKYLEDAEKVEDIVVRTIDKVLPPKLVVSVNSTTGDIQPTPEFWRFLEATFDSTLEKSLRLEGRIKKIVGDHPELLPLRTSNEISAEEYHEYTQKAIKNYLEDFVKKSKHGQLFDNSAIVTRDVFTQMLRKEIESMRDFTIDSLASLEKSIKKDFGNVKEEVAGALNDYQKAVDSKIGLDSEKNTERSKRMESQLDRYEDDFASQKARNTKHASFSGEESKRSILLNGTTLALDNLIKKSIEKYILHTISKPDFADPATGARVNSHLTSPSYNRNRRLPFLQRQLKNSLSMVGFGRMKINPPSTAFNNDINLGSCWPFNGPSGHVALTLGSVMSPTDLGLIHVGADHSSNPTSAPRRVSLWVEVADPELRKRVSLLVDQSLGENEVVNNHELHGLLGIVSQPFRMPPTYVKIVTVEYDLLNNDEFQVFPIPMAVQRLGIKTRNVLFSIESNWGHSEFTCVYRLRLFGHEVSKKRSGRIVEGQVTTITNQQYDDIASTGFTNAWYPQTEASHDDGFEDNDYVVGGEVVEDDDFFIRSEDDTPAFGSGFKLAQADEDAEARDFGDSIFSKNREKGKVVLKRSLERQYLDSDETF